MARGEYFLANLTRTIEFNKLLDPIYVAVMSCIIHDTPFRFFYHESEYTLLGLSPERFLKIENGTITCEPMKGTAVDGSDLINNIKEHEENTMMIDLVRSDLSRICESASIRVVNRNRISLHPGLAQMSSSIEGSLQKNVTIPDAIKRMMPIASVTGTPKPYVVKKIAQYEPCDREIYCGTYGWVDTTTETCDLAVGIRTIEMNTSHASIGSGAGITLGSNAESEWRETELKASRLTHLVERSHISPSSKVFTSLRVNESGLTFLLKEHCDRLSRHARSNGMNIESSDIENSTKSYLASCNITQTTRLRILVEENGISHDLYPFSGLDSPLVVGIAPVPVFTDSVEIPKYIDRDIYDRALADGQSLASPNVSDEIDNVLLLCQGHITETNRANIFVRIGNDIFTPPKQGILEGVLREHLLRFFENLEIPIQQISLSLEHLMQADEIVTTNSVRGAVPIERISSVLLDEDLVFNADQSSLLKIAQDAYTKGFS